MNILNRKLIVENPTYELEYIKESTERGSSELYIQGIYMMSEQKNKNGRIYMLKEMIDDVSRYTSEMIIEKRSLGELNHPTSIEVNPERACHMVTELRQEGNFFVGKSKILSTPVGQIVRNLINDGVKLGVSTRALGKLEPGSNDCHMVKGFHLIACDVVHDPSVPKAFVNGILESKEWIVNHDGSICEAYENFEDSLVSLPCKKSEREKILREKIELFLKIISKNNK